MSPCYLLKRISERPFWPLCLCASMPSMLRQTVAIAGPAGSGKDSIIRGVIEKCPKAVFAINATTRPPRPSEKNGVNYHFFSNGEFLEKVKEGIIPEHYHRKETDTYYGLYRPELDAQIAKGNIVFFQIQIVGAKFLKKHYDATTFFITAPTLEAFEHRVRARAPMSDAEWSERREFTKREIEEEAPWYDYKIVNEDGKLEESIERVIEILQKEGYDLGI